MASRLLLVTNIPCYLSDRAGVEFYPEDETEELLRKGGVAVLSFQTNAEVVLLYQDKKIKLSPGQKYETQVTSIKTNESGITYFTNTESFIHHGFIEASKVIKSKPNR